MYSVGGASMFVKLFTQNIYSIQSAIFCGGMWWYVVVPVVVVVVRGGWGV